MNKEIKCCFCKKIIKDYGNNPAPFFSNNKRCCDNCNIEIVIPMRININRMRNLKNE